MAAAVVSSQVRLHVIGPGEPVADTVVLWVTRKHLLVSCDHRIEVKRTALPVSEPACSSHLPERLLHVACARQGNSQDKARLGAVRIGFYLLASQFQVVCRRDVFGTSTEGELTAGRPDYCLFSLAFIWLLRATCRLAVGGECFRCRDTGGCGCLTTGGIGLSSSIQAPLPSRFLGWRRTGKREGACQYGCCQPGQS